MCTEYRRRKTISQIILWGYYYPNAKPDKAFTRKEHYRPISLIEHRDKNPQQSTIKMNSAIYRKDNTLWLNGIYLRNASLVQHLKINHCDLPCQQTKEE